MSKVKVQLLANTVGAKRGDVIEVEAEDAKALIANHNAVNVKPGPKSEKD